MAKKRRGGKLGADGGQYIKLAVEDARAIAPFLERLADLVDPVHGASASFQLEVVMNWQPFGDTESAAALAQSLRSLATSILRQLPSEEPRPDLRRGPPLASWVPTESSLPLSPNADVRQGPSIV